jgi:hypothetical protein
MRWFWGPSKNASLEVAHPGRWAGERFAAERKIVLVPRIPGKWDFAPTRRFHVREGSNRTGNWNFFLSIFFRLLSAEPQSSGRSQVLAAASMRGRSFFAQGMSCFPSDPTFFRRMRRVFRFRHFLFRRAGTGTQA